MDVAPFPALRYSEAAVGSLADCVSLPYDQFGDEGRDERYRRDPHNVVRLIKPRPENGAPHEAARRTLRQWRSEGVLRADERPAIYPYRQRFSVPGSDAEYERWSFICRLRLTPFETGPVYPHERTYPDTVGERSRLREIVGADFGLILVVYDDADGAVDGTIRAAAENPALFEVTDEAGTRNALWAWQGDGQIEPIRGALESANGFIADGHHRYTAALGHWQHRGGDPADPAGHVMVALVSAASPGLRILPTHRLTEAAPGADTLASWRSAGLDIERVAAGDDPTRVAAAIGERLGEAAQRHAVGVVRRDGGELVAELVQAERGALDAAPWPADVPQSWRSLDVPMLHSLMLDPWMGALMEGQTHDHGAVDYRNDVREAVDIIAAGSRGAAFLLNPLSVRDVQQVVAAGDVLPPKSTNFFPKVISGLTIHSFADTTP